MLLLYFVMMLVATPLTMGFSLGQIRFCYMCGGARGAKSYVFHIYGISNSYPMKREYVTSNELSKYSDP